MSRLTRCNFCTLVGLQLLATQRGHALTLRPAPLGPFRDGVDVYIHPADYTPPKSRTVPALDTHAPDGPDNQGVGDWWAAWFASLPEHCCCGE